jgi:acyl-CoA reductase-like NAD-dependent aldehyde dehydrogenase
VEARAGVACGCTIAMKPPTTSLSAPRIAELALEAGLPPGAQYRHRPGRVVAMPSSIILTWTR